MKGLFGDVVDSDSAGMLKERNHSGTVHESFIGLNCNEDMTNMM